MTKVVITDSQLIVWKGIIGMYGILKVLIGADFYRDATQQEICFYYKSRSVKM